MNRKILELFIIILIIMITGCSNHNSNIKATSIDESKYKTKNFTKITCVRNTETEDDSKVDINYEIFYNADGYIEIMKSFEKVTSNDKTVLKSYKDAYEEIYSVYDDLDYYDNEVIETDNTVTSTTYINYGKIDMNKLMNIEGTEDNVKVTNGKIKLDDWKTFARQYGTECSSTS